MRSKLRREPTFMKEMNVSVSKSQHSSSKELMLRENLPLLNLLFMPLEFKSLSIEIPQMLQATNGISMREGDSKLEKLNFFHYFMPNKKNTRATSLKEEELSKMISLSSTKTRTSMMSSCSNGIQKTTTCL